MPDKFWKISTDISAALLGISDEHKEFVASGYKCSNCRGNLLGMWRANFNIYAKDGTRAPSWKGIVGAELAECPNCSYRWRIYSKTLPLIADTIEVLGITESERSEEPLGVDRRLIDNSKSSTKLTRRFSISKEWTKTYTIEYEKSQVDGTQFNIGVNESVGFQASSEETIRKQYSISEEEKETYLDEVEVEVPGFTKLSLSFQWKRIWQHGLIRLCAQNDKEICIPFRVAVGITFDQLQIDEKI